MRDHDSRQPERERHQEHADHDGVTNFAILLLRELLEVLGSVRVEIGLRRELRGECLGLTPRKIVGDVAEHARDGDGHQQDHSRVLQLETPIEKVVPHLALFLFDHPVTHFLRPSLIPGQRLPAGLAASSSVGNRRSALTNAP